MRKHRSSRYKLYARPLLPLWSHDIIFRVIYCRCTQWGVYSDKWVPTTIRRLHKLPEEGEIFESQRISFSSTHQHIFFSVTLPHVWYLKPRTLAIISNETKRSREALLPQMWGCRAFKWYGSDSKIQVRRFNPIRSQYRMLHIKGVNASEFTSTVLRI